MPANSNARQGGAVVLVKRTAFVVEKAPSAATVPPHKRRSVLPELFLLMSAGMRCDSTAKVSTLQSAICRLRKQYPHLKLRKYKYKAIDTTTTRIWRVK